MSIAGIRTDALSTLPTLPSELRRDSPPSSIATYAGKDEQTKNFVRAEKDGQSSRGGARHTSNGHTHTLTGLPNIFSTKIEPASSGRSKEQVYKDFFALEEVPKSSRHSPANYWGNVTVAPSIRTLSRSVDSGAFEREHGGIKLPNVKDDSGLNTCVQQPEELRKYKDMAERAANVGRVVYPQGTRLMRHYLDDPGKPLETVVSKHFSTRHIPEVRRD